MTDSNQFHYSNLYELLEKTILNAQQEVLLVAPFIKKHLFNDLINSLDKQIKVTVITRWRIEEILSGVSDIGIWELLNDKDHCSIRLLTNLHAKYYRIDEKCIFGSANLTQKALRKSENSNLEFLYTDHSQNITKQFEEELFGKSVAVTEQYYNSLKKLLDEFETEELNLGQKIDIDLEYTDFEEKPDLGFWIPKSRNPEMLYEFYSGNKDRFTIDQVKHGKADLSAFSIPPGLSKSQFKKTIGIYLLQTPIIQQIDQFLSKPRRFGEISNFLEEKMDLKNYAIDSKRLWQTLMRWLLFYLDERYEYKQPRYSEVFLKKSIDSTEIE